jgi:GR25 family glycosyltransferase involved in LPS biosynthesis
MTEPNLVCYWINLDDRKDRAAISRSRLEKLELEETRISATTRAEIGFLEKTRNQRYFRGILACRMSHMKAMEIFLESDKNHCLILEDDFIFENSLTKSLLQEMQQKMEYRNIQLLQIGHLPLGNPMKGFSATFFRVFNRCALPIRVILYRKISHSEFVDGFSPGTHAYIINRNMAEYLVENCRLDLKTPLDNWYSKLAKKSNRSRHGMVIARLRFSIVSQDVDSRSDLQY